MKKLYWYNLIVFGLLVLAPQVFGFFYRQRYFGESIFTVQYISSFSLLLSGILLIYKNIRCLYNKNKNSIKQRTLHKVIVGFLIFLNAITILIGLLFLAIQYGFRNGVGF